MFIRSVQDESGASAVEFALVLPLLLLILFAIIEYGWFFANRIVLTNAAGHAVRSSVKAREWEGEEPAVFAARAFKNACWIVEENAIAVASSAVAAGSAQPGRVAVSVTINDSRPRTVAVTAVMGYRPLTGFLPVGGADGAAGPALMPAVIAAKAVMTLP